MHLTHGNQQVFHLVSPEQWPAWKQSYLTLMASSMCFRPLGSMNWFERRVFMSTVLWWPCSLMWSETYNKHHDSHSILHSGITVSSKKYTLLKCSHLFRCISALFMFLMLQMAQPFSLFVDSRCLWYKLALINENAFLIDMAFCNISTMLSQSD